MFRLVNSLIKGKPTLVFNVFSQAGVKPYSAQFELYPMLSLLRQSLTVAVLDELAKVLPAGLGSQLVDQAVWDKVVRATYDFNVSNLFPLQFDWTTLWHSLDGDTYQSNDFVTVVNYYGNQVLGQIVGQVMPVSQSLVSKLTTMLQDLAYNVLDPLAEEYVYTSANCGGSQVVQSAQPFAAIIYQYITPTNASTPVMIPVGIMLGFTPSPSCTGVTGNSVTTLNSYVFAFTFYFVPWTYLNNSAPGSWGGGYLGYNQSIHYIQAVYWGVSNQYSNMLSQLTQFLNQAYLQTYGSGFPYLERTMYYVTPSYPYGSSSPPSSVSSSSPANGASSIYQAIYLAVQAYTSFFQSPYSLPQNTLPSRLGNIYLNSVPSYTVSVVNPNVTVSWIGGGSVYVTFVGAFVATRPGQESQITLTVKLNTAFPTYSVSNNYSAFGLGWAVLQYLSGFNPMTLLEGYLSGGNSLTSINNFMLIPLPITNQFVVYSPDTTDLVGDIFTEINALVSAVSSGSIPVPSSPVMITGNVKLMPAGTVSGNPLYDVYVDVADGLNTPSTKLVLASWTPYSSVPGVVAISNNIVSQTYLRSDYYVVNGEYFYAPLTTTQVSTKLNTPYYLINTGNPISLQVGVVTLSVTALNNNYQVVFQGTTNVTINEEFSYFPQDTLGYYTPTGWVYYTAVTPQSIAPPTKKPNVGVTLASLLILSLAGLVSSKR